MEDHAGLLLRKFFFFFRVQADALLAPILGVTTCRVRSSYVVSFLVSLGLATRTTLSFVLDMPS